MRIKKNNKENKIKHHSGGTIIHRLKSLFG